MLGTRTLRKGGVMIRWLGRLGRCVGTSYYANFWSVCVVCSGCVLGHLIVSNDVYLHFPLYYHDVVVVMSCNFHSCLLYVSHARIDPVGSHAPHHSKSLGNKTTESFVVTTQFEDLMWLRIPVWEFCVRHWWMHKLISLSLQRSTTLSGWIVGKLLFTLFEGERLLE